MAHQKLEAPAVPSDAEIEANIWPALRLNGHPNLTLYDCIASIRAALTAAPTPPAQMAWVDLQDGETVRIGDRLMSGGRSWALVTADSQLAGRDYRAAYWWPMQRMVAVPAKPAVPEDVAEPVAFIEHSRNAETGIEETDLVWSRDEDLDGGLFWYTPLYAARKAGGE